MTQFKLTENLKVKFNKNWKQNKKQKAIKINK